MTTLPAISDQSGVADSQPVSTESSTSGQVLITEQEVMFGTAPALARPRRRRFVIRNLFGVRQSGRSRRPASPPRRHAYLEQACLSREMHRL